MLGTFPPEYRSGLGRSERFEVPSRVLAFGQGNVVAIRVYRNQSRSGFNVAAPVVFAGDCAIRLAGSWETTSGDDPKWSQISARTKIATQTTYSKSQSAEIVNRQLRRLDDEGGPLAPAQSLARITHPADLEVEVAISEPDVQQPVSFKWDHRGRLWVSQYVQYPDPVGLRMVSRDKFLRTVYDKTPLPPPHHEAGLDKITIHEDANGDGVYEASKTFVDGLNMVTSFAIGRGGVWVLNPPYLLFYADSDQDDVPDGSPKVHLEGFGLEDSHSLVNNLRWGPDGWLYAAQGSTVSGRVKRYGSDQAPIISMGAADLALSSRTSHLRSVRRRRRQCLRRRIRQQGSNFFRAQWPRHARLPLRPRRVPAKRVRKTRSAIESICVRLLESHATPRCTTIHARLCDLSGRCATRSLSRQDAVCVSVAWPRRQESAERRRVHVQDR